jgi:Putative peptidoglycan binding domain/Ser-Thr-rich glycosyl-phosphatidyl-inositol-anchored membrane family
MKKIIYISMLAFVFAHTSIASATCYNINFNAKFGNRDTSLSNNVSALQSFLREFKYLAPGPSGYFGPGTFAAVKIFQSSNAISPVSGFVGQLTRSKIKTVSCSGDSYNPNPINNPPTGNSSTIQYGQNALSTHTLYDGQNIVYRYKITAPDNNSVTISNQNFSYAQTGLNVSSVTLQQSFNDYFNTSAINTATLSDSNLSGTGYMTKNFQFTFASPIVIPAGRTAYFQVVEQIYSRNYGGSLSIAHPQLGTEKLYADGANSSASIVVNSPNTGETLTKNSSYTIRWSTTQLGSDKTLSIALVHTDGTVYNIASVYGSNSGTGEYQWTIPSTIQARSRYRIRITSGSVTDVSDMTFVIQEATPKITVTSPTSSDTWNIDSTTARTISWTYEGFDSTRTATVYLLFPDGTQCTLATPTLGKNSISGSVQSNSCSGGTKTIVPGLYKIGVGATTPAGASVIDYTDTTFTIVSNAIDPALMAITSPNGGESLTATQDSVITWTTPSSIASTDYVSLSLDVYSSTGATSYKTVSIASSIRNAKTYTWSIPSTLGGVAYVSSDRYKIRVTADKNSFLQDSSNNFFSINPLQRVVTITAPTQTSIARDTNFTVSWNKAGFLSTDKLNIVFTPAGGTTRTVIASDITVNDGTATVKLPIATALNSYKITLVPVSYTFGSGSVVTSGLFALTNKSGYSITPSSVASTIYKGDYVTTTWSTAGLTAPNISVRLLTSAGDPIAGVGAVTVAATAGEKDILIPTTLPTGSYKFSYVGTSDGATVTAYSNTFTVTEPVYTFTLNSTPTSATRNDSVDIGWTSSRTKNADTVNIRIQDSAGNVVSKNSTIGALDVTIAIPSSFVAGAATVYATTTGVGYTRPVLSTSRSITIVNPVLPSITVQGPAINSTSTGSVTASWVNNNFSSAESTITSIRVSMIQSKGSVTKTSVIESGLPPSTTSLVIPIASNGALGTLKNVGIDLAYEYQIKVDAMAGSSVVTTGLTAGTFRIHK